MNAKPSDAGVSSFSPAGGGGAASTPGSNGQIQVDGSPAWTQVLYQLDVATRFGDSVFVIGSDKALGNWDIRRALQMFTGSKTYPRWRSCTAYVLTGRKLEYKFIICHSDGSIEWENGGNRHMVPTGGRILLPHTFNVGMRDIQILVPLFTAWDPSASPSFLRVQVPNEAGGPSWKQHGKQAHVLFRRLRGQGVEYLFEHRSPHIGKWEDGAGQLCLPGGSKHDDDSDSRYTAFRRVTETCLGSSVRDFGFGMLYEAFKFSLVDLLTVSASQGGYYVCDIDELAKGLILDKRASDDWVGSRGVRTELDVDCSVFPTGCTWIPVQKIKEIIDSKPCSYTTVASLSTPCETCTKLAENVFMKGVPLYGPLKKNLARFRHKLWI